VLGKTKVDFADWLRKSKKLVEQFLQSSLERPPAAFLESP
jgi:hypothetical protein